MKVSVVIPFYNSGSSLQSAVESALEQPETGEIILVNDGSTDDSAIIANELSNLSPKIKLVTLKHNLGPAAARNQGIKEAAHALIAFLDADDQYLPKRFEQSTRILLHNPEIDVVYGATKNNFLTDELKDKYKSTYGYETELIYLQPPITPKSYFDILALAKKGSIHLNALLVRKNTLQKIKGFDHELKQMEDTDLILRLALKHNLASVPANPPVAIRNIHHSNLVFTDQNKTDLRLLFLVKWINISIKEHKSPKVIFHFIRSYLGEHPYAGRGKFNIVKTWFRKMILLFGLIRKQINATRI